MDEAGGLVSIRTFLHRSFWHRYFLRQSTWIRSLKRVHTVLPVRDLLNWKSTAIPKTLHLDRTVHLEFVAASSRVVAVFFDSDGSFARRATALINRGPESATR